MREKEYRLLDLDVKVAVVTFENDFFARQYVAETGLDWPLLIDAGRDLYRGYGMLNASFWDVWGAKSWMAYLRALRGGERLHASEGDVFQRGGDVLIDPAGMVRFHHIGAGPADRPSVDEILCAIGTCRPQ